MKLIFWACVILALFVKGASSPDTVLYSIIGVPLLVLFLIWRLTKKRRRRRW